METTKGIDQDVVTLHSELARHDGKFQFHCTKRCKYIAAIVGLLLLMFLFGMLTRSTPDTVVVKEVTAVLDERAPQMVQPELNTRLTALFESAALPGAAFPTLASTATAPAILSWTPQSVGRVHRDGTSVPLSGSYVIPAGWFGIIRLTADGEEIGSTLVDSRTLASPAGVGRFTLTPTAITGERLIHLSFDAVKACRITCAVDDQLCLATNVNTCTPLFDNQSFLTYTPTLAEALPPAGTCIEKTFVAGPKYAPQIPEDYTMCAKGMWNGDIPAEIGAFSDRTGLSPLDRATIIEGFSAVIGGRAGTAQNGNVTAQGRTEDVAWQATYRIGNAEQQTPCFAELAVAISCDNK